MGRSVKELSDRYLLYSSWYTMYQQDRFSIFPEIYFTTTITERIVINRKIIMPDDKKICTKHFDRTGRALNKNASHRHKM